MNFVLFDSMLWPFRLCKSYGKITGVFLMKEFIGNTSILPKIKAFKSVILKVAPNYYE